MKATEIAPTGIKLDRDPASKYPGGKAGARRMIRRGARKALLDPRRRENF